MQFY